MMDVITTVARVLAMESGAQLTLTPGVACTPATPALRTMADALLELLAPTGVELLALRLDGSTLTAEVREDAAEEPLCPAAFHRVVRSLSYRLLGEVWDGRLEVVTPEAAPASPATLGTPAIAAPVKIPA